MAYRVSIAEENTKKRYVLLGFYSCLQRTCTLVDHKGKEIGCTLSSFNCSIIFWHFLITFGNIFKRFWKVKTIANQKVMSKQRQNVNVIRNNIWKEFLWSTKHTKLSSSDKNKALFCQNQYFIKLWKLINALETFQYVFNMHNALPQQIPIIQETNVKPYLRRGHDCTMFDIARN